MYNQPLDIDTPFNEYVFFSLLNQAIEYLNRGYTEKRINEFFLKEVIESIPESEILEEIKEMQSDKNEVIKTKEEGLRLGLELQKEVEEICKREAEKRKRLIEDCVSKFGSEKREFDLEEETVYEKFSPIYFAMKTLSHELEKSINRQNDSVLYFLRKAFKEGKYSPFLLRHEKAIRKSDSEDMEEDILASYRFYFLFGRSLPEPDIKDFKHLPKEEREEAFETAKYYVDEDIEGRYIGFYLFISNSEYRLVNIELYRSSDIRLLIAVSFLKELKERYKDIEDLLNNYLRPLSFKYSRAVKRLSEEIQEDKIQSSDNYLMERYLSSLESQAISLSHGQMFDYTDIVFTNENIKNDGISIGAKRYFFQKKYKKGNKHQNLALYGSLKKCIDFLYLEMKNGKIPKKDFFEKITIPPDEVDTETFFLRYFSEKIPFPARQKHTYILGQSGSGKTELLKLFIWNDIKRGNGVFVLDPHGELAKEISRFKLFKNPETEKKLVYISPEFSRIGKIPRYNPFENDFHKKSHYERFDLIGRRAGNLVSAFETIFRGDFTPNMENMVHKCVTLMLSIPETSLQDFLNLLNLNYAGKYLKHAKNHFDPQIKRYFSDEYPETSLEATRRAIRTRFEAAFSNYTVRKMMTSKKGTFDIKKALRAGKCVIINASQGRITEVGASILGAFLIAELNSFALNRVDTPSKFRKSVFAYIDECQNFLNPKVDKILSEARKYGLHLTLTNQHLGQLAGNTDLVRIRKSILSNTAVKICGTASQADQKEMAKAIGIKADEFVNLRAGKFAMKAGYKSPCIFQAYDFLIERNEGKNPNYLEKSDYVKLLERQTQKFYLIDSYGGEIKTTDLPDIREKKDVDPKDKGNPDKPIIEDF